MRHDHRSFCFIPCANQSKTFYFPSSPQEQEMQKKKKKIRVRWKFGNLPLNYLLEVSLSPLAWTCDAVYERVESTHAISPQG